ncbi:MAG: 30S ribosomal protein S13 [Candidatus Pacearchaeota archaeon]|nr:30S ribosomal protein S13 [Candidatus Pacearchaeota archaeon]
MEKQETKEITKTEEKKEKGREEVIRIAATDIPARLSVYAGLTKIKGISWAFSSAICRALNIDKKRKISTLTDNEIEKITSFVKNPSSLPSWILNRRYDIETGKDRHLITTELDLQREFDIRRMKKIKCYKGIRHALGQPVRGQRTRSHFRKGRSIGVTRSKTAKPAASEKK